MDGAAQHAPHRGLRPAEEEQREKRRDRVRGEHPGAPEVRGVVDAPSAHEVEQAVSVRCRDVDPGTTEAREQVVESGLPDHDHDRGADEGGPTTDHEGADDTRGDDRHHDREPSGDPAAGRGVPHGGEENGGRAEQTAAKRPLRPALHGSIVRTRRRA